MQVFEQLSIRGLTHGMVTQKPVILRMTIPDFMWQERKKAVYLDGIQVHGTDRAIENDQEIDALLELKGWSVLRLPYNPPLTGKALAEVMQRIEQFLGEP
jgi:very-short-patch-repair endonuclease